MNLARNWYFVQVGPLDPRAKTLPLPDDLDGPAGRVRRRARSRPHARLPAQHEGQLDVLRRRSVRDREVGQEDGPHADADGLLALQLRRAARRQHRRRPISSRASDRTTSGRRCGATSRFPARRRPTPRRRRSTSGRASRTRRRSCASPPTGSAGSDPGELTEAVGDEDAVASTTLGLKNLKRVAAMLLTGHDDASRASRTTISKRSTGACSASGRPR